MGYTHNVNSTEFIEGTPIAALASDYNDLYPSFNNDFSEFYLCSDRENDIFNIYYTPFEISEGGFVATLENITEMELTKVDVLSSSYDDKCPFILGNTMVFTSNRPGGEGGYDLYYSKYENNQWSAPVNFGPTINSPDDEYRPILIEEYIDLDRYMLIFSSNRSGGKGGYDLYFVGVDK